MAYQSSDLLAALAAYHPDVDLGSLQGDAEASAQGGATPQDFVAKYVNDPRITQAYVNKYTNFAQPSLADINSQIGIAQQQGKLNQSSTEQQYGNTAYDIQQNQLNQNQNLFNQADQMGLSRAGVTGAGTGRIAANTTQALSYNDAQRANSLASIALQTSGNVGQLQGKEAAIQADIGQQARQDAYGNSQNYFTRQTNAFNALQNINPSLAASSPSYAALLSTMMQRAGLGALDPNELQAYFKGQIAQTVPSSTPSSAAPSPVSTGGSTYTYPTSQTQTTPGMQAPANNAGVTDQIYGTVYPYLQSLFSKGGWQGLDLSSNGFQNSRAYQFLSGIDPNLNPNQASYLYYHVRKQLTGQ